MKICLTSSGKDKDDLLEPRFGRCPYFLVYDDQEKSWQTMANPGEKAFRGAGISAAQAVVDAGCKVIITGNIGPHAFQVLSGAGMKIYQGRPSQTVKENLLAYQQGKLSPLDAAVRPGWGGRRF